MISKRVVQSLSSYKKSEKNRDVQRKLNLGMQRKRVLCSAQIKQLLIHAQDFILFIKKLFGAVNRDDEMQTSLTEMDFLFRLCMNKRQKGDFAFSKFFDDSNE